MYVGTMLLSGKPALVSALFLASSPLLLANSSPTIEDARRFLNRVEKTLLSLNVDASRADWVKSTYITDDTEILAAQANEKLINATVEFVKQSKRFESLTLPPDLARKMHLLRVSLTVAAPSDPKEAGELS